MLAIKERSTPIPVPAASLLTGSANLMNAARVATPWPAAWRRCSPASGAVEIANAPRRRSWNAPSGASRPKQPSIIGDELVETVLAGGYPEDAGGKTWGRRQDWCLDYVDAVVQRDVRDIANVDQLDRMPRLCGCWPNHSAGSSPHRRGLSHRAEPRHHPALTRRCSSSCSWSEPCRPGTATPSSA